MELRYVDPTAVEVIWPLAKPLVERAINRIATQPAACSKIEAGVLAGEITLWIAYDEADIHAAITMQITDGDCELLTCGGSRLDDFLPLWENMEQFARERGCTRVCLWGRRGWQRVLDGYKTSAVLMEKKL